MVFITSCANVKNEFVVTDKSMEETINIGATVEYKKLDKVSKNDIVVFYNPKNNKPACLRVIGFPGEKIEIIKGKVLINDKEYTRVLSSNSIYTVYSKKANNFSKVKKYNFKPYSDNYGMVCITRNQLEEILREKLVDSIYQLGFDSSYIYPEIIKTRSSRHFNHYYFGPISIPQIGDTILKDDQMLIDGFSNFDSDNFIIDDQYYFCIGDSFSDAMDSRVFGLIPRKKIIGKVSYINNVTNINVESQE